MPRLVDSGRAASVIILPADAGEVERFAARELAQYLHLMSGAVVPAMLGVEDAHAATRVFAGAASTSDASFPIPEGVPDHRDGYLLRTVGADLHIVGATGVGVLYGVYDLLSAELGVGFVGLGRHGDEVPERHTVDVADLDRAEAPAELVRGLNTLGNEADVAGSLDGPVRVSPLMSDRLDWMAKHRLNTLVIQASRFDVHEVERCLLPEAAKRSIRIHWSHHNMGYWLPTARYGKTHPEFYAVRDAVRKDDRASQLCLCTSNPAVADEVAANMVRFLREHPWVDRVGLWPNDGYGMCECDACARLDRYDDVENRTVEHFPDSAEAVPLTAFDRNKTNRYVRFLNDVADRVTAELPDARISALFYADMLRPATDHRLHEAVEPMIALYWRCSAHSLHDAGCPTNTYFARTLDEWLEHAPGRVSLYEYYMGMDEYVSLPFPISETMRIDWQAFSGRGVTGASIQSAASHHAAYGFNYALFAALAWDPGTDIPEFVAKWNAAAYGPGADAAADWWEALSNGLADIGAGEGPDTSDPRRPSCYTPTRLNFPVLWDERIMSRIGAELDRAADLDGFSHGQARRFAELRTYHVYGVASDEAYERELDARELDEDDVRLDERAGAVVEALDRLIEFVGQIGDPSILFTKRVLRKLESFRRMWAD